MPGEVELHVGLDPVSALREAEDVEGGRAGEGRVQLRAGNVLDGGGERRLQRRAEGVLQGEKQCTVM